MTQNILTLNYKSKTIGYLAADIFIFCFIYLLPSLSHLTSIPFYLFEPMRLAIVFCIVNTNRSNSLFIALTLPIISLLISSHPVFLKSMIITAELAINVIVFYFLSKRLKNLFIGMILSIFFAKIFYYSGKIVLLGSGWIQGNLISTPIWIQCVVMLMLSIYTIIALRNNNGSKAH